MRTRLQRKTALQDAHREYAFIPSRSTVKDLELCLADGHNAYRKLLIRTRDQVPKDKSFKVLMSANVALKKFNFQTRKPVHLEAWFSGEAMIVHNKRQINTVLRESMQKILGFFDGFVEKGSGWVLKNVLQVRIVISQFKVFAGGCINHRLPLHIRRKRACICVKGITDNLCFLYAIAASLLMIKKNAQRKAKYSKVIAAFSYSNIKFPVSQKDVVRFEKSNDISVNVYAVEDKVVYPHYVTAQKNKQFHANLLLFDNHYYCIRNMSSLVSKQQKVNQHKTYVCNYCLSTYITQKRFETHLEMCQKKGQRYQMPLNKHLEFTRFENLIPATFVIYADLESLILKEQKTDGHGKVISKREHVPISIGAIRICKAFSELNSKVKIYTGRDCIDRFIDFLESEYEYVCYICQTQYKPMVMTKSDVLQHNKATCCEMCKVPFTSKLKAYRDHCHVSGKYRQALCNVCNLNRADFFPKLYVIFHGLSNYDSHFVINVFNRFDDRDIRIIPLTGEKYLTFSVGNLHFKDSYKFLSESLDTLATNLSKKGKEYFPIVNANVKDPIQNELMKKKGVFPYSYMTSEDVLSERNLPPKKYFYNDLRKEHITEEAYSFAQHVFKTFKCKSLKDYMHVYLSADILLLADIFENYRSETINDFKIDPVFYFSSPHVCFDAFLYNYTPGIELLTDIDHYLFLKKALRGGLSMICKRYSKANNKYLSNYDAKKPSKYILYLDANNLYGKAMSESLPQKSFQWMKRGELDLNDIMTIPPNGPFGCVLEVDLEYPEHLHTSHSDYPLAAEKRKVNYKQLSPYSKHICDKFNLKRSTNCEKLMTTLYSKTNYVLHYRLLQFYVNHGLVVKKIHRGLKFHQSPFLKEYIEFNSKKRAATTNEFDSAFYKLNNNSVFGKTIERNDNRCRVKLTNNSDSYEKLVSKPTFKSAMRINKDLTSVSAKYPCITLDKPFFVGVVILELSKFFMLQFHYDYLLEKYAAKAALLFTDTDSLAYEIECEDVYKDLQKDSAQWFDFSNYPPSHPNFSNVNKKIPGLFKDETASIPIKEFVGLKSKMYSFILDKKLLLVNTETKVAKGVKKSVIEKDISFHDYYKCLMEEHRMEHRFKTIRSIAHQVYTSDQTKVSLSPFDDKRFLLNNCFTLPHGHRYLKGLYGDEKYAVSDC
jgi:hypothetical protein